MFISFHVFAAFFDLRRSIRFRYLLVLKHVSPITRNLRGPQTMKRSMSNFKGENFHWLFLNSAGNWGEFQILTNR